MGGDAAVDSRRPSRRSSAASSSAAGLQQSTGGVVDAACLDLDDIAAALENQNQKYLGAVDFVNASDEDLEALFVTDRVRGRRRSRCTLLCITDFCRTDWLLVQPSGACSRGRIV